MAFHEEAFEGAVEITAAIAEEAEVELTAEGAEKVSEFLLILAVLMGTAIVSTATAYLCRSAEIASNIAVLFMFPMNLPFHMVADSLFETTQNPFFVTLLCLPYLMIFAAGAVGVSKNR